MSQSGAKNPDGPTSGPDETEIRRVAGASLLGSVVVHAYATATYGPGWNSPA